MQSSSHARVQRSRQRIADVRAQVEALTDVWADRFDFEVLGEEIQTRVDNRQPFVVPTDLSIATGEVIYNLRCALDYFVFSRAKPRDEREARGVMFPVVNRRSHWKDAVARQLPGVLAPTVALIETYQPFNGCQWTATLRDLSNADKHRDLVTVDGEVVYEIVVTKLDSGDLDVQPNVRNALRLPDGSAVLATLDNLADEVAAFLRDLDGPIETGRSLGQARLPGLRQNL